MNVDTVIAVATMDEIPLLKEVAERLHCESYPIIVTGVGPTNVARSLGMLPRDVKVVNIGYAGSLNVPKDSIVEVSSAALYHPKCEYVEPVFELQKEGYPCFSSCDFVTESQKKDCLFDMELAFICAMGFREVRAVKVISDNLNYDEYEEAVSTQ